MCILELGVEDRDTHIPPQLNPPARTYCTQSTATMGLGGYFKSKKPGSAKGSAETEKATSTSPGGSYNMELQPPHSRFGSSRNSISARSTRSTQSTQFMDDIKHEVMVNYLYQQQCSRLWVSDGSGEVEGVLLRKSRGFYMACPPRLGQSPLAEALNTLNVQVSRHVRSSKAWLTSHSVQ